VEDSGEWSIYMKGRRNPKPQTFFPQTFIAGLYRKPSYLSNLHMHGLGIVSYLVWFVKPIWCKKNLPKPGRNCR